MIKVYRNDSSIFGDLEEAEVENLQELLNLVWVREYQTPEWQRFSVVSHPGLGYCNLMVEYKDGSYKVVGTVLNCDDLDLPRWQQGS